MSPGYEAREAILKALGSGNPEGASALVAVFAPEDPVARRAVRVGLLLQNLYELRRNWRNENRGQRDAAYFGLDEAIRRTEPIVENARTALRRHWPHPGSESDQVLF